MRWKFVKLETVSGGKIHKSILKFSVRSVLGKEIRTTRNYWELIVRIKHPGLTRVEGKVKKVLLSPDQVRQSSRDTSVYLYYRREGKYYLCIVVKHLDGEGFLITSYLTDRVKVGKVVYQQNKR